MRQTFILRSMAAMFALAAATACGKVSLDMSSTDPEKLPVRLSKGAEFVAAAQRGEKSIGGYSVDTSVGSVYSKLEATTPSGYKVYSTVQGHIISDEKSKIQ